MEAAEDAGLLSTQGKLDDHGGNYDIGKPRRDRLP
jgi:hypothetical protein